MTFFHYLFLSGVFLFPAFQASAAENIGFFTPQGAVPELVSKTGFVMIKAYSVEQVKQSLAMAEGHSFLVHIDFEVPLTNIRAPQRLHKSYVDQGGIRRQKLLSPLANNKVREFPSDAEIKARLAPYLPLMQSYRNNIGTIFLVDEPYLNGVSKKELERAGAQVRASLDAHGLKNIKLGTIFASAMFNKDFARRMDRAAGDYTKAIDQHYNQDGKVLAAVERKEWELWKEKVPSARLTTYDSAGNMYVGGGIPTGFDVVGFDFYLSTILLDGLHERTLDWFSSRYPAQCGRFKGKSMRELRTRLSFFQDGPVLQGKAVRDSDRALLDAIFDCRMTATLDLLNKEIAKAGGAGKQVLLIAESSNNGVLEFDSAGNIERSQSQKATEERVYDEVMRALRLYRRSPASFGAGLMFFTYQNEYDYSIKLHIGGAKAMPSVMNAILSSK